MAREVDELVAALRAGGAVLLPTDTVYGLCCDPFHREPVRAMARLKERDESQPVALLAADVDVLRECVPELRGRASRLARRVLPGPYTLILPNPAGRLPWLSGSNPGAIGVRVPELQPAVRAVVDGLGAVAATSANLHGMADPRGLDDVSGLIRSACAGELDGGELPGTPSTVLDLTGPEPRVLREGAGDVAEALARLGPAR